MNKKTNNLIVVMSGGLEKNGDLPKIVKNRLKKAISIRENKENILCTGGSTYHKPQVLDETKRVIFESKSMTKYLISENIDPRYLYQEWASFDTLGSIYFSFLQIIIPKKIPKIKVITCEFHIERVKKIFNWLHKLFECDCEIIYFPVKNDLETNILKARIKREKKSLGNIKKNLIPNIHTISDFHNWFYTEHKAYCSKICEREIIPEDVKKTY